MKIKILLMALTICLSCCTEKKESTPEVEKTEETLPVLKVYNMGGVPEKSIAEITQRLKLVYENTEYGGDLQLVDSAYIKNDRKGNNRYWNRVLMNHLKKVTDTKNEISLVFVNADICNWTKNGSHANLGMSLLGSRLSMVSYNRLKVNNLNTVDNMLKVSIHELGHSVCSLVKERKDLRFHCPDKKCMMLDANNKFPYRNTTGFCSSCDSIMQAHGFKTENLNL